MPTAAKKGRKSQGKGRGKGPRKGQRRTAAAKADRRALYQLSVQAPEPDIEFFERVYRELRGKRPKRLREDFCGTAHLAVNWAQGRADRTAVGVDIDASALAWGRKHNLAPAGTEVAARVELLQGDVRETVRPRADLTCAMNFSFCVFKTRAEMGRYFETARRNLKSNGVFIAELYGGTEAIVAIEERRELDGFTYVWQQASYNPLTHETLCHIHFEFADGSRIDRAFTYDWRLWGVQELRELLLEAGFRSVDVYWETVDDEGVGTGEYVCTEEEENQEGWIVYLVAAR